MPVWLRIVIVLATVLVIAVILYFRIRGGLAWLILINGVLLIGGISLIVWSNKTKINDDP